MQHASCLHLHGCILLSSLQPGSLLVCFNFCRRSWERISPSKSFKRVQRANELVPLRLKNVAKKNDSYRNIRTCRQIGQGSLGEFVCLFCSVAGFLFGQVCKSWKKQDGARANAKVSYIKYISNYIILYACVYLSTYMSICMYIHVYIYKFPKKNMV